MFGLRSRVKNMDSAMSADTRINEELLDAARKGDDGALAALVERHRDQLERMVRLRMDRRLQGRVDPADVVQDAYLAARGKFPRYRADPRPPFFLWLRLEVGQKLVDVHRFHLSTQMRDAGQEVSLHGGPLPQVTSLSLAEHLRGKLTPASHARSAWPGAGPRPPSSPRRAWPPRASTSGLLFRSSARNEAGPGPESRRRKGPAFREKKEPNDGRVQHAVHAWRSAY
jgi:hypothetical protein